MSGSPVLAPRSGALGFVGLSTQSRGIGDLHSYGLTVGHAGHRCCFDAGSRRYALIARRFASVDLGTGECSSPEFMVIPARCKSYACPCCGPWLIGRNRARASSGCRESGDLALLTVTLDPEHPVFRGALDASDEVGTLFGRRTKTLWYRFGGESRVSVRFIARAWNRWVTYARRYEPRHVCRGCLRLVGGFPRVSRHRRGCHVRRYVLGDLAYFRGLELQRNGRAHYHAILRVASWAELEPCIGDLTRLADSCGFGGRRRWRDARGRERRGFEIERARSAEDVARYVSKAAGVAFGMRGRHLAVAGEVAKARQARHLPARARRASWSLGRRAWAPLWVRPERSPYTWEFSAQDPVVVERRAVAAGFVVRPERFRRIAPGGAGGLRERDAVVA